MVHFSQALSSSVAKSQRSDWRDVVRDRLRGSFFLVATSERTAQAEMGLSLPPSVYWFVSRVDTLYGRVVMIWRVDAEKDPGLISLSPFDTGGLWHEHITLSRTYSAAQRAKYVSEHSSDMNGGVPLMHDWLRSVYVQAFEYVAGAATPDFVLHSDCDPMLNDAPAWSWEARAEKDADLTESLVLEKVFWADSDFQGFRQYLRQSLDVNQFRALATLLNAVSDVSPTVSIAMQRARGYVARQLKAECFV